MRYVTITANTDTIYYIADKIDADNDNSFGINLTFYSYNKVILKKLYNLLYNIEEGKFFRRQSRFRLSQFRNEQLIFWLHRFGLEGEGNLYKVSLEIEDVGTFRNCYLIAKRIVRRIAKKFSFLPILHSKDINKRKITLKLQKYFMEKRY